MNIEMTTLEKIERLQGLQQALEGCTRPVKGHTDPLSINDCWNWMRELLQDLKELHSNGGSPVLAAGAADPDPSEVDVIEGEFAEAGRLLLKLDPSGEDSTATALYSILELFRDKCLGRA